ncbi:hypothetical protein [uncultured Dysgonomonas sp.]|uniref:DUF5640 domain-containing protein n=1 Tax=uncultured Dysgonomonas sp. TaxID=206096 RepID=A0A212K262_9BACT|nr:hypothetical protein [uncultured Dysgonomonas sp.]SBW05595.1 conserved exported hypothetical protein [uncultured Dysgonomonas sp.]
MKKLLLLLLIFPLFISCGGDDEKEFGKEINSKDIVGSWSTGVEGTHKYISFDEDNTGFYALYSGATIVSSYTFDYVLTGNQISLKIKYSFNENLIGKMKVWDCELSSKSFKVKNEAEAGAYTKIK